MFKQTIFFIFGVRPWVGRLFRKNIGNWQLIEHNYFGSVLWHCNIAKMGRIGGTVDSVLGLWPSNPGSNPSICLARKLKSYVYLNWARIPKVVPYLVVPTTVVVSTFFGTKTYRSFQSFPYYRLENGAIKWNVIAHEFTNCVHSVIPLMTCLKLISW